MAHKVRIKQVSTNRKGHYLYKVTCPGRHGKCFEGSATSKAAAETLKQDHHDRMAELHEATHPADNRHNLKNEHGYPRSFATPKRPKRVPFGSFFDFYNK